MPADYQAEYIIEPRDKRLFDWKELWYYRELLYFFTWRDVKVKYKQTVLGILWALLQPVLMMIIFTLFFSRVLKVSSDTLPYPVFAFSGLLVWNLFSSGVTNAATSMVNQAQIIRKIYFPRLVVPVSSVLSSMVDFSMAFFVFIGLLIYYRVPVDFSTLWFAWPLAILVMSVGTFGPGIILSALNVKYRDFRYVIPFAIQVAFFLTPVIYPVSMFSKSAVRYLLALNPMYGAISLIRMPLNQQPMDTLIWISFLSGLVLLALGLFYFKKTERYFADLA